MERKTEVQAEPGKPELRILRSFDLPVELLFRAHVEPEIIEQWLGSRVLHFDARAMGSYQYEKRNAENAVIFRAHGCLHACVPNVEIIRTFEIENAPYGVQLEFYRFESRSPETSQLELHIIFQQLEQRDAMVKQGMPKGLGFAHDRMQQVAEKYRSTLA